MGPAALRKSLRLSAALNLAMSIGVGGIVAVHWGSDLPDPISLSSAWPRESVAARALGGFLCVANFASYCLDSVPLGQFCQRRYYPSFVDNWSCKSCLVYMLLTLPAFIFALVASIAVGQPGGSGQ